MTLPPSPQARRLAVILGALGVSACAAGLPDVKDAAGSDEGSGWLVAAGGDPARVFGGYDFFPKARVILGAIKASTGEGVGVFGMAFTGTIRASF